MTISPKGSPKSPVWVVIDEPYPKDYENGGIYSSGLGYVFERAWRDANISEDPFICAIYDNYTGGYSTDVDYKALVQTINMYKPPIICTMGEKVTALFCPETRRKKKHANTDKSSLEKWAGSLLQSPDISYEHYCIPQLQPDRVVANWEYRFIYVNIDLRHIREELSFFHQNQRLQPLPERELIIEPSFTKLREYLYDCFQYPLLSVDIETIRPTRGSKLHGKHPGYPYTLSISSSPKQGISFCLWDYTEEETIVLFRLLDTLLSSVGQIGQNYFTFDAHFLKALGFRLCLEKCQDTMLRHSILWPSLPHKLQFLTKHYTRQPYYKDEGKGWSPKNKKALMHYNCLDTTVTFECYLGQEEEFQDRPYLI